jgi:hypothetical protein
MELDFDMKTEPTSLEGRTRTRLGLPLESGAERAQEKGEQIQAILSGKEVDDTPLGLKFLSTGVNLLAATPAGKNILEKLHLGNVTFVVNPSTDTYGATVEFEIPVGPKLP